MLKTPFWPRRSPHFAALRHAVRPLGAGEYSRLAVGFSGGPDSLALTAALCAEFPNPGSVQAICVDHGLQPGSRETAERAAAQARAWGARARVVSIQVDKGEVQSRGVEAAARAARYRAFSEIGLPVCVGHTADDQAETLLLSALRGQATGMSQRSEIEGALILRPLLQLRRADTEAACAELGVNPWRDPHNTDPGYRRVRIRTEVLPLLGDILGGDAGAALAQAAADLAADNELLAGLAADAAEMATLGATNVASESACLDCRELAALPEPLRRRVLRDWLLDHGVTVTRAVLGSIGALCTNWHGQGPVAVAASEARGEKIKTRLEVRRIGGKLALLSGN